MKCQNCKKDLEDLKTIYNAKGKKFCSTKCAKGFFREKETVQEYKRKCNECGRAWHSLVSREKEISRDIGCNACIQGSTACGGNLGAATQSKRSVESQQDLLDKLKKCPKCGSKNYIEEIIVYEKK